jgi:hypothetical protein
MAMTRYFNLDGNLIFESSQGNGWVQWVKTQDGLLNRLIGDIKIDKDIDVTILNRFRDRTGEPRYKSLADVTKYVNSLPKWNKTKYYSKITDLGCSGLLDCKTGDVIDSGFEYDLQPHLIIKNNHTCTEEKCAICGNLFQSRAPLALFLFDLYTHSHFRLVCDRCGEKYAPILTQLIMSYFDKKNSTTEFKIQD